MRREPGASPDAEPFGDAERAEGVQHAVERFVELHSSGQAPDIQTFTQGFPVALRPQILAQCREFLSFDGMLGHQEWEPDEPQEAHGRTFGDFVIEEELGRGGMGIVYLATQRSLNRRVALKVMASGLTLSKRHVERFRREAAAAAQLRHPAIVPVHSLTEVDGTFALAMDFVAGRNLADILDDLRLANGERPLAIDGSLGMEPSLGYTAECAMFCAQIASALATAHQAGIVHRDLKPRNLMIDDHRQARLLDFGLAKSLGEGSISMSGEITGTAHYMSPEQTLAKRVVVDHRADIWALGVILYELLTLKRPFDGKNLQQVVYEICFKEPVAPQKLNPKVPRDLVTICQKALEKDPQTRYQAAAEMEADLQRFLRWEPIHAKPAGAVTRLAKWVRRHRTGTAIAAVATLLVLIVLGVLWYQAVLDDQRANQYLQEAQRSGDAGHFTEAIAAVNQALLLRNDEATRARLDVYYERSKTAATQRETDKAEAALRVAKSNREVDRDRELAIQLALAAVDLDPSLISRSAVLEALGSGYRTTILGDAAGTPIHDGLILGARWSPDGKRIVTTGADGKVLLWDAVNGALCSTLVGHADKTWVVDPQFVADGERLLTAGADRTLRLWRTADGGLLQTWNVPGAVSSLYTDRKGNRVLTTGYGSPTKGPWFAEVLDTNTGAALCPDVNHNQLIRAAALSPNGEYAATWAGERNAVRLWHTNTGETVAQLADLSDDVRAIMFAPDSSLVAVAAMDGSCRFYSVPAGQPLYTVWHSRSIDTLTFDADGARLLTGSRDQTARLWQLHRDPGTGALSANEERTFVGHGGRVLQVAFDRSNALALTAGEDGVLRVFDAGSGRASTSMEILRYEVGAQIESAAFDPEGRRILAVAAKQQVMVWDFGDTRGVVTLRQPGAVPAACFDANGNRIVTAGDDERLRLWNARDGRLAWVTDKLGNPVQALDVDDAGERIAISTVDGRVRIHRLDDGEPLFELIGHTGRVPVVRFADRGRRLLTAGAESERGETGRAIVWNTNNRSQVLNLSRPHLIATADLSPDGTLLATVERNEHVVRLWTVPAGELRGELSGHSERVTCVRFAPDGRTLLTASRDRTARVQTLDGTLVVSFPAEYRLQHATFSHDGRSVLTTSAPPNFEAQLWSVADGTEQLRFTGHRGIVDWGAFSPDDSWAVTTSRDGTARIWPTDPVAVARRLPLRTLTEADKIRRGVVRSSDRK